MAREHRFSTSNKFGKEGERDVLAFIERDMRKELDYIEDVSNDPEYQKKDIDAVLHFKNGQTATVEIKTDSYCDSGNLAFEVWSSISDQIPGCMYKTECDYLYYYFPESHELYQFKMNEYRDWVEKNKNNFHTIYVKNVSWGKEYYSFNYLIPKTMLKATYKNLILYNLAQR